MEDELRESQAERGPTSVTTDDGTWGRLQQVEAELERVAERASLALAMLEAGNLDEARAELARVVGAARDEELPEPSPLKVPLAKIDLAQRPSPDGPDSETSAPLWDPVPPPVPSEALDFADQVDEDELDFAFATAETEAEQMHDANRVAERVLEESDPEPLLAEASSSPVFATETMAELLEGQGHSERAQAIRQALHVATPAADESSGLAAWDELDAYAETWPGDAEEGQMMDAQEIVPAEALASRDRRLATLESWLENVRRDVA